MKVVRGTKGAHPKTGQFRFGIVTEVDAARARVKVRLPEQGDLVTQWLPVASRTAHKDGHYGLPEAGNQVALLTDQFCEDGICLGAIYSDPHPIPVGAGAGHWGTWFEDGTVIRYDKTAHGLLVDLSATQGPIQIKGGVTVVEVQSLVLTGPWGTCELAGETIHLTAREVQVTGQQVDVISQAATVLGESVHVTAPTITLSGVTVIDGDIDI
jgi:phage baseplate assembly protein V